MFYKNKANIFLISSNFIEKINKKYEFLKKYMLIEMIVNLKSKSNSQTESNRINFPLIQIMFYITTKDFTKTQSM